MTKHSPRGLSHSRKGLRKGSKKRGKGKTLSDIGWELGSLCPPIVTSIQAPMSQSTVVHDTGGITTNLKYRTKGHYAKESFVQSESIQRYPQYGPRVNESSVIYDTTCQKYRPHKRSQGRKAAQAWTSETIQNKAEFQRYPQHGRG